MVVFEILFNKLEITSLVLSPIELFNKSFISVNFSQLQKKTYVFGILLPFKFPNKMLNFAVQERTMIKQSCEYIAGVLANFMNQFVFFHIT